MKHYILLILILLFGNLIFAQNGQINGKVLNSSNGEPIAFATIIVDGTQIYSTSDIDGNYSFTGLKAGYLKLRAFCIGYKQILTDDILVSNNNSVNYEIKLDPSDMQIDKVVIKTNIYQKDEETPISMQKISLMEIESNPGSNRDISKVIQSFPGVGSTPNFRNDIIVRGGGPSESRFFIDEIEIPNLNHFATQGASGGPTGIINADFIQSVKYYSGAFPADRYNALSAIFEFKQKDGNKDKLNVQATLGASDAALTFDGPIGKKTTFIFSVRRSYLQFLFSIIGLPFLPTYNDYQFKIKTEINKNNTLTIVSLGALDNSKLNLGIENPTDEQQYILTELPVNNQWSYTIGAVYKNYFSKGSNTFVLSRNMLNNQIYKYPENNDTLQKILDYNSFEAENKARYEFDMRQGKSKISFGVNGEFAEYRNKTFQKLFINNVSVDANYDSKISFFKYGMFGQFSHKFFNEKFLVSIGFRIDGNNFSSKMQNPINQFSPRIALSYNLFNDFKFNAGAGRFFQLPAYTTLGYRSNDSVLINKNISYLGNNQVNFGFENVFNKNIFLSVEGFYKDYFNYPIDTITGNSIANTGADYSVAGASPVISSGKGRTFGIEVLNRINVKGFSFMASYTFFRSEFTNKTGIYYPSSWDSKHLLTITAIKDLPKNWRIGLKWRFVGGLPYTPYDLNYSSLISAWNVNQKPYYDYSKLNSLRFKAFHQLDMRIDKNFFFNKWTLMLYVDVQNVYNFKTQSQDYVIRETNPDGSFITTDGGTKYILKEIPSFAGTVLPTLGIMIKL